MSHRGLLWPIRALRYFEKGSHAQCTLTSHCSYFVLFWGFLPSWERQPDWQNKLVKCSCSLGKAAFARVWKRAALLLVKQVVWWKQFLWHYFVSPQGGWPAFLEISHSISLLDSMLQNRPGVQSCPQVTMMVKSKQDSLLSVEARFSCEGTAHSRDYLCIGRTLKSHIGIVSFMLMEFCPN